MFQRCCYRDNFPSRRLAGAELRKGGRGTGAANWDAGAALSFSMVRGDGRPGGGRVSVRPLAAGDQDDFVALARASVGLHHPWYTMPTTPEEFQAYLARFRQPSTEGFLVCAREGGAMAGMITIDSIVRGRFQSASLSYAAFAPAAGRGYMSEGLALVLLYAFTEMRLHRLEANIAGQPGFAAAGQAAGVPPGGLLTRACCSSTAPGEITSGGPSPGR